MKNIDKIIDNAFIINRESTKHKKEFKYNTFSRPVTISTFFQLLANSNINKTSYELYRLTVFNFATDYVLNWKSEVKLNVSRAFATIDFPRHDLRIELDYKKFTELYSWFNDKSVFETDFGTLSKSENYYK